MHSTAPTAAGERLIDIDTVLGRVRLGRSAWYERVRAGTAPAPVHLGRAAAWVESEIDEWIAERVRARTRR